MKALGYIALALVGVVGLFFAFQRLGAPAVLLLGAIVGAGLLLARKVKTDPHTGWGYLRAFGWMAALASGVWTVVAFASGALLLAIPLAGILVGCVLWIQHCTRKIKEAHAGTGHSAPSAASQNLEAANDLTSQVIANARRSQARGRSLHLQGENLDLTRRNRELEEEVAKLQCEAAERDAAMQDPFYDPIPKA